MTVEQLTPAQTGTITIADALEEFRLHQRTSRHTPKTLEYYDYALGRFERWLAARGIVAMSEVDARTVRQFLGDLQAEGLSPATVHLVMRAVRALCRFLEREELIGRSPMVKVQMPRLDKKILPAFTPEEVATLLRATDGRDLSSLRNHALVLTLLDSGLRLHECAGLTVGDIDRKTGALKVMGKGRKERLTRVGARTLRALLRYLRARDAQDGEPLWVGKRGAMTQAGIAETLEKLGKRAEVHTHAHKFRRTCALMLLRNGADVFSVQHLLGHADLTVLRRYLAQTETDVLSAHARACPMDF